MDITSPKYGHSIMRKFFGKKASLSDYSQLNNCLYMYPSNGIVSLGYEDKYQLSAWISYLPHPSLTNQYQKMTIPIEINHLTDRISFRIEVDQRELLHSIWKVDDVDESTYDYFLEILNKISRDIKETSNHIISFNTKGWIKRNKQLSLII